MALNESALNDAFTRITHMKLSFYNSLKRSIQREIRAGNLPPYTDYDFSDLMKELLHKIGNASNQKKDYGSKDVDLKSEMDDIIFKVTQYADDEERSRIQRNLLKKVDEVVFYFNL